MCLFFIFKRQKKFATHPSLAMSYGQPIGVKRFAVVRKITIFLEYHVVSFDKPFAPRSIYYLFQFIQESHVNNSTSGLECVKIQIIFATVAASETFFFANSQPHLAVTSQTDQQMRSHSACAIRGSMQETELWNYRDDYASKNHICIYDF